MSSVTFTVRGFPAPQGSKRAIVNRYSGKAALIESSKRVKPWRADVREAAITAMGDPMFMLRGPLYVELEFRLPRPKGHYRTGIHAGELKPSAPEHLAGKPDIDKLARAVLDAITGIVWTDDAQVTQLHAVKRYVAVIPELEARPSWVMRSGLRATVTELLG